MVREIPQSKIFVSLDPSQLVNTHSLADPNKQTDNFFGELYGKLHFTVPELLTEGPSAFSFYEINREPAVFDPVYFRIIDRDSRDPLFSTAYSGEVYMWWKAANEKALFNQKVGLNATDGLKNLLLFTLFPFSTEEDKVIFFSRGDYRIYLVNHGGSRDYLYRVGQYGEDMNLEVASVIGSVNQLMDTNVRRDVDHHGWWQFINETAGQIVERLKELYKRMAEKNIDKGPYQSFVL